MPRQWKLIALYMVIVYLTFIAIIKYDKQAVSDEARVTSQTPQKD